MLGVRDSEKVSLELRLEGRQSLSHDDNHEHVAQTDEGRLIPNEEPRVAALDISSLAPVRNTNSTQPNDQGTLNAVNTLRRLKQLDESAMKP